MILKSRVKVGVLSILAAFVWLIVTVYSTNSALAGQSAVKTAPLKSGQAKADLKSAPKPAVKPKPGTKELLWKVTSDDGATLYLIGTIHVFKPEYYPLPDEMDKALQKSRALILEIDMTKQDKVKTQGLVRQRGLYPPSDDLARHLSKDTGIALQNWCNNAKMPYENFVHMKPWLASLTITQSELDRLGYKSQDGVDLHLMHEAVTQGKKVIGLETEEFQLNLFADLSSDLQDQMLKLTLVDMDLIPVDAGQMMQAWREGNTEKMDELMTKDVKEHPEFAPVQEKILYERNVTMAQKLEMYLKGTDTYLCAVGCGHLCGDRSIIELLKKKGYKVTQLAVGDPL